MKFKPVVLLLAAVMGVAACGDDPTAAGVGVATDIVVSRSVLNTTRGSTFSLSAYTIDANFARIPGVLTVAPGGAAISLDSVVYFSELTETRIFARSTGAAAPAPGVDLLISGHGLSKTTKIVIP